MSAPVPDPTHYAQIGGEEGVRRLVDRFYDLMDTAPEAATVRALHARSLKGVAREAPPLPRRVGPAAAAYVERHGHPRLRMRHFPFAIGERERDEWLWCMDRALDEHDMPVELRGFLKQRFHALADHMRNQPG
jgi:hemoglobin